MELKPAHETLLKGIQDHCSALEVIEKTIAEGVLIRTGSGDLIPLGSFEMAKLQNIGGLCSLLEVLRKTIIPADKLDGVIAGLKAITYRHCAIWATIEKLKARKT
jgi:hypothetical protein